MKDFYGEYKHAESLEVILNLVCAWVGIHSKELVSLLLWEDVMYTLLFVCVTLFNDGKEIKHAKAYYYRKLYLIMFQKIAT